MKQVSDEKDDRIVCSVFSELKTLGVKVPKIKKFKSSIPKQVREISSRSGKIFGVSIGEQEKICIADYVLPKFVFTSTSYLKKYSAVEIGLFRKAGSITRQRDLRAKLERGESIEESEPNDVASLLKQWLRELPEPLIPAYMHDLFMRCQNLPMEESRIAALLLCCHLLPFEHLHTLKYLLEFLSEMASNSDRNKMGVHNLALIMAPNIFVWGADSIDKSSNNLVQLHTSILELLINNVQRIIVTSCSSSHSIESEALKYNMDLDLSIDALDCSPSKSKKKRKSGPVQDLFTGIRKLVGQNSTPQNSSKRWNPDDVKLAAESAPRSASKRKADPEQLTLSPIKKQATATRNILQNVGLNFTPDNKCSQSVFGTVKEKTGSAHSRRKSFGLLRRKEKKNRQKASKPNEILVNKVEPKGISTPSLAEEKLATLQNPEEGKVSCVDKSSPLLSTSDIDRILSKSTFTKKSISDCYLSVHDEEYIKRPTFSTSSSEGCLHSQRNKNSPYNLRSSGLNKPLKRKSDVLNGVSASHKENVMQNISPQLKAISPLAIYTSPQQETLIPKDLTATVVIKNNFRENDCTEIDCLHSSQSMTSDGQKRRNLKDKEASFTKEIESPKMMFNANEVIKATEPKCTDTDTRLCLPSFNPLIVENEDKIKRQCSLKRQEAFVVRSKNSKRMNSHQIRRADSIKIANSKSKNHKYLERDNSNSSDVNITDQKNHNLPLASTTDKKRIKRSVRNGSIVRGRPNSVKTGLPSDMCSKYNESVSRDLKHDVFPSASVTGEELFKSVINELDKKDVCITIKTPNIVLSTPSVEIDSKEVGEEMSSSPQTVESLDMKETGIVSKTKCKERICSNSDSKVHKMKTRSSKVARIHSFPENTRNKPKVLRVKELRSMNLSNHKKSKERETTAVSNEVDKENTFILESPLNTPNDNVFKTPSVNFQTPETWYSGREFLESENPREDDAGNKRESIAMILRNKQGHVQQKVHMYDHRIKSSSTSTPSVTRSARRVESLYDPQYSNMQTRISQKRSTSVRSNRSGKNKYSPLPPPPKFVIPDSPPKPSYPLKELTNINSEGNTTFSPSPLKASFISTPNKDSSEKMRRKCTLKPKRNSYSGHTPYKLPKERNKVLRSESSPLLQKAVNKSSQKLLEFVELSPLSAVNGQNSAHSSAKNSFDAPVFKTKSSLSIDKLRLDQLTDEWHCEM